MREIRQDRELFGSMYGMYKSVTVDWPHAQVKRLLQSLQTILEWFPCPSQCVSVALLT
jgi:hypothetical protein